MMDHRMLQFALNSSSCKLHERTLQVSCECPAKSIPALVAYSSCIHALGVLEEQVSAVLHFVDVDLSSARSALAVLLRLAYHLALGPASPWHTYVSTLPTSVPSLLHVPLDSLSPHVHLLRGTPLEERLPRARASLSRRISQLRTACQHLPFDWLHGPALLRAHALYTSRAMYIPVPPSAYYQAGGGGTPAMVPLLDMADHRPGSTACFALLKTRCSVTREGQGAAFFPFIQSGVSNVSVGVDPLACLDPRQRDAPAQGQGSQQCNSLLQVPVAAGSDSGWEKDWAVGIQCGTSLSAGQAIFISYGPLTNAALASRYGFALPGNAADILPVRLARQSEADGSSSFLLVVDDSTLPPGCEAVVGSPFPLCTMAVPRGLLQCAFRVTYGREPDQESDSGATSCTWSMDMLTVDAEVAAFRAAHGPAARAPLEWVIQQLRRLAGELAVIRSDADDGKESQLRCMCVCIRQGLSHICSATVSLLEE